MKNEKKNSLITGFYKLSVDERLAYLVDKWGLTGEEVSLLKSGGHGFIEIANNMIENVVGRYSLPLGIAVNFMVNGKDVLVPMVIEEPSVIAGASFMAKLARLGGGFKAVASPPEMIGQIQLLDIQDIDKTLNVLRSRKKEILDKARGIDPTLERLGGGPRDLEFRTIDNSSIGDFIVIHLIYDVRDAMGANAVNSAVEKIAPFVEKLTGGRVHLRILSNLSDRRLVKTECTIPVDSLDFGEYPGDSVRDGIIEAWAFADSDPYRASTHNKGIMNGIDAVLIATGNDWRAVEAGAHAYAARDGSYTSLSKWWADEEGNLRGSLEMPLAVGIIGGATRVHPTAKIALKILGVETAGELAEITASVGLAQNLAAIRALATEGIQRGHMRLHARQLAISAGAQGDWVEKIASNMVESKEINFDKAVELIKDINEREENLK